mmetsp:Transcript_61955/g.134258  ORF Transcript_61955/g.134258 Transcript_61955/m.134258 type:complete len:335 (+) Transcript_61955:79-1083(+)
MRLERPHLRLCWLARLVKAILAAVAAAVVVSGPSLFVGGRRPFSGASPQRSLPIAAPGGACHSASGSRTGVRLQAAAPWDLFKGTFADPNYWQQQQFLASALKKALPNRGGKFVALELSPADPRHIGYLKPDAGPVPGTTLSRYIGLGKVSDDLRQQFGQQGEYQRVGFQWIEWEAGKRAEKLQSESVDVALVAEGTSARLGRDLRYGLAEVLRALKFDGRVIIIANQADEAVLGGDLQAILEYQNQQDISELRDLEETGAISGNSAPPGQVLRLAGLRLVRTLRDECGLSLGVCVRRDERKVPRTPRATKAVAGATRGRATATAERRSRPKKK